MYLKNNQSPRMIKNHHEEVYYHKPHTLVHSGLIIQCYTDTPYRQNPNLGEDKDAGCQDPKRINIKYVLYLIRHHPILGLQLPSAANSARILDIKTDVRAQCGTILYRRYGYIVEHYGKRIKILLRADLTGHGHPTLFGRWARMAMPVSLGQPSKGHPSRISILISIMFYYLTSTTNQKIGDLFCPVHISRLSHSVCQEQKLLLRKIQMKHYD